ncbi:hypothetical protein [Ekhidna sp. To15]|uniref:hypothetical protein n=1 Tax=Ekhidna sp. To15 TaxID=3395267 RepID=UPI003F524596
MKQPLALRFDRIIKENLPKRANMMQVLMDSALSADLFYEKGMGVQSILKQIGRLTDFKGIYGFIEGDKMAYIDESAYVIRRIVRQFKGNSKYQMKLAHTICSIKASHSESEALDEMKKMKIVFMDVPDDLERQITTLYLQCQFECIYNRFE